MDPKVQQRLIRAWLPRLRELTRRRRPLLWLMVAVLLVPLVVTLLFVVHLVWLVWSREPVTWTETGITSVLLPVACLSFVYLGKLQSCSDGLLVIELAVYCGDADRLSKAIGQITCFAEFQGVLRDAARIASKQ